MKTIEKNFEIIKSAFATKNIEINLYKFDKRFKTFLYSQNLKWIILDFLFPFVLSIFSIILLYCKIF